MSTNSSDPSSPKGGLWARLFGVQQPPQAEEAAKNAQPAPEWLDVPPDPAPATAAPPPDVAMAMTWEEVRAAVTVAPPVPGEEAGGKEPAGTAETSAPPGP